MTTTAPTSPASGPVDRFPTRFREAEARSHRLGRPLRLLAGVGELDDALMERIGRGFLERDEAGARLADAMRMRAGTPGRVTHEQLRVALHEGLDAVPDAPAALVEFIEPLTRTPDWVDWEKVAAGASFMRRFGQNAADTLLQLSLVGGYRFGGPTDLLVATGGLTGGMTLRRLAETQAWGAAMGEPEGLRPGGEAWRLTLHVRAMHALVNAAFEPKWDIDRWGVPISQTDLASTLGLFDGVPLIGCRALGVPISREESRAYMHLWKYVGWLMGVHEDFLVDTARERHHINYHVLMAQAAMSEAGPPLAQAVVEAQSERRFSRFQGLRRRWERERLLSMLTVFLGPESMREFGLPLRPPWAMAYVLPLNALRYRVLGRLPGGQARLERWGKRVVDRVVGSYYGPDDAHDVLGDLPTERGTRPVRAAG